MNEDRRRNLRGITWNFRGVRTNEKVYQAQKERAGISRSTEMPFSMF